MRLVAVVPKRARSETFIRRELEEMSRQGAEVACLSLDEFGPHPRVLSRPFSLARVALGAPRELLSALKAPRLLACGADLLYPQFLHVASTAAWLARRLGGPPFVVSVHAWDVFARRRVFAPAALAARLILTCTEAARAALIEKLPRLDPTRVRRVYHGLDASAFRFRPPRVEGRMNVLAAGRFVEKKGFGFLAEAVRALESSGRELSLTFAGDGPLKEGIRARAPEGTHFPGWVSEDGMRALMEEADVFCAPSVVARDGDRDGIPNVVLEAMASGCAAVTTRAGGLAEAVEDERTGLFAEERDPKGLADALARLDDDRAFARTLAGNARAEVERRFNLKERVAERIEVLSLALE